MSLGPDASAARVSYSGFCIIGGGCRLTGLPAAGFGIPESSIGTTQVQEDPKAAERVFEPFRISSTTLVGDEQQQYGGGSALTVPRRYSHIALLLHYTLLLWNCSCPQLQSSPSRSL